MSSQADWLTNLRLTNEKRPLSSSLLFNCQKSMTSRLQTNYFYSLKVQRLFTALAFNDKFLHRRENDQSTSNLSQKLTMIAHTYPILSFSPSLTPPFFRKNARNTVQTSLSSICKDIRCTPSTLLSQHYKATQTLLLKSGSLG